MAGDQAEEEKSRNMVVSSSTAGFCYPDVSSSSSNPNNIQTHLLSQIQSFHDSTPPEIFNLTTAGMDMINNFQHKNNSLQHHHHQSFFSRHGGNNPTVVPSSSKTAGGGFYDQHDQNHLMAAAVAANNHDQDHSASWQENNNNNNRLLVDDSSLRCVFTCEGNERPSQGLSLSLSSNNPSSIGLQSFELRQQQQQQHPTIQDHHHHHDLRYLSASSSNSRDGFYGKSVNNMIQHHHQDHQQGHHHQYQVHLRNSKFLGPAQELLNEFCCLGSKQTDSPSLVKQNKPLVVVKTNNNQWEDDQHGGSTSNLNNNASSKKPSLLSSLELIELQKRKAKLLSMLEEVDRRYKHYCDQMKAVVSSFEAVAGNGAAKVYSALASKAMSRHFRCLRDGIVVQIQDTKTAMGEKDPVAPGTTRGETPRLRLLDQTLRQQRALQQMTMMESHPWRPQRGLPERSVSVLRAWLFEHFLHPYPSDVDKHILARQTGLSRSQVSNWFINARVRLWKPMVEEMYLEETKDHLDNINNNMDSSDLPTATGLVIDDFRPNQNPNTRGEDQKPTPDELVRIDSECLSSIISTNPDRPKNDGKDNRSALQNHHQHQNQISFGRVTDNTYGAMELDFSSYNHHTGNAVTYDHHASHESGHHTFGGGGGGGGGAGVSLTLGLQQHGGSSLGLAFSPASQNSLFYSRDHIIDDCQPVQYSILDGEGQNNLPYRNLLGAQLLHDLAG